MFIGTVEFGMQSHLLADRVLLDRSYQELPEDRHSELCGQEARIESSVLGDDQLSKDGLLGSTRDISLLGSMYYSLVRGQFVRCSHLTYSRNTLSDVVRGDVW